MSQDASKKSPAPFHCANHSEKPLKAKIIFSRGFNDFWVFSPLHNHRNGTGFFLGLRHSTKIYSFSTVREIDKTGGGALDRCSRWKVFLEDTLYSYGHSFNKHSTAIRYSRMVWLLRICVRYSSLFLKFLPRYHQSSFILTTAFFSSGDFSI